MDPWLVRLLELLDATEGETVGTSVRDLLEAIAQRAVLDAYYEAHPDARPDLAEIALAAAQLDGHPLAERPELVRRAAAEIVSVMDDPTPDEVLSYAAGLAAAA
jgi:hypothetical protein